MITLLVVCCISMVSSWFSVMSCNEITRFHAQLKPVQNYTFLKDPRVFVNNLWGKYADLIVADPRPQADTSALCSPYICDSDTLPPTLPGGRAFSLRAVNRMFSFAAFFTARATLCVMRYDQSPFAIKLGPECPGVEIQSSVMDFDIRC